MRTLVIDCATPALSLALFDDERCVANRHQVLGRGHAESLVPLIGEMLDGGRADAIAVDVGPGSFTGIRVGIAAARALGFAWGVPVTGYGCLPLCAAIVRDTHGIESVRDTYGSQSQPITIVMTGGHGELFWQRFDPVTLEPLGVLVSTPVAALAAQLMDDRLFGSGAATLVAARGAGEAIECLPDARAYFLLPAEQRDLPSGAVYGREADAKPMAVRGAE